MKNDKQLLLNQQVLYQIINCVIPNLPNYNIKNVFSSDSSVLYNSYDNTMNTNIKLLSHSFINNEPHLIQIRYIVNNILYEYTLFEEFFRIVIFDIDKSNNKKISENIQYSDIEHIDQLVYNMYIISELNVNVNDIIEHSVIYDLFKTLTKYNTDIKPVYWYELIVYFPNSAKDVYDVINAFIKNF